MKFDEFLDLTAEEPFLYQEGNRSEGSYVFESESTGKELRIRRLPSPVTSDLPVWSITVNDEKVEFDNPAQLITVSNIVKGLCVRSINVAMAELKKEENA